MSWTALVIGYVADLIFGDPRHLPHPVRAIGAAVSALEKILRKNVKPERVGGAILTVSIVGGVYLCVFLLLKGVNHLWPIRVAIESFLIFTALCTKGLAEEPLKVLKELERGRLKEAKELLSSLVSRETRRMGEREVLSACIETISENTVDGIISPLFYLVLGGVPGMMAFKAVDTLDSMVGYRNERYLRFGWAAAKLDDLANFIPARVSVPLIALSAFLLRLRALNSLRIALRDGRKHESPNSGLPEGAFAGALGVRIGGPAVYFGTRVKREFIGDEFEPLTAKKVREAIRLMKVCSGLAALFATAMLASKRYWRALLRWL